ncbi:MAG: hypothetical protein A2070_02710 [Bdellovibrionales bacterium GWC1_52_8]|nr:MAG: hypothetical protein A2Z97_13160 [Bdellovibrionales bacterium GWB1_52_6]OFZ05781.1 MAG: hypothetical protein A2X97_03710 [Bdellovibrionales bacterium GWA1_52_35]OFZ43691.1 MAG: hypothetical protein A2070_02710 [Bdellovibrionales bacterium GWC1_52_8]
MTKTSRRLWILAILNLIGVGIAAYQTQHFYALRAGVLGFKSFCNINTAINCDVVALSRYAELAFGLPLSSFAAGWFLGTLGIVLMGMLVEWRRDSLRLAFGMTAFATVFSMFYFYVMAGVLNTFCLLCLLVDLVSISSLGILISLKSEWWSAEKTEFSKFKSLGITVAVAMGITVLTLKGMEPEQRDSGTMDLLVQEVLASPVLAVTVSDELPSVGPKNAPITIVEFADFQCPGCKTGAMFVGMLLKRYPEQIRFIFRNYPLDAECNKNVPQKMHPVACEAARLVYCAHRQGKFHDAFETLFENQAKLTPGSVAEFLAPLGLNMDELKTCTSSSEAELSIMKDVEEASRLGAVSTPTFFINGHKMEGALPLAAWDRIITQLLKK